MGKGPRRPETEARQQEARQTHDERDDRPAMAARVRRSFQVRESAQPEAESRQTSHHGQASAPEKGERESRSDSRVNRTRFHA